MLVDFLARLELLGPINEKFLCDCSIDLSATFNCQQIKLGMLTCETSTSCALFIVPHSCHRSRSFKV